MNRKTWLFAATGLLVLLIPVAIGLAIDVQPGNTAQLLEAYQQARDSIRTIKLELEWVLQTTSTSYLDGSTGFLMVDEELPPEAWPTAPSSRERYRWEIEGDQLRMEQLRPDDKGDYQLESTWVYDGQTAREISRANRAGSYLGHIQGRFRLYEYHPYVLCFLQSHGGSLVPKALDTEYATVTGGEDYEWIDGHATLRLSFNLKHINRVSHSVWLDRDAGWMPRRIETYDQRNGELSSRFDRINLVQVNDGIWFPLSGEKNGYVPRVDGRRIMATKTYYTIAPASLKINQPIPPERFSIDFPAGTTVYDQAENVARVIGDSGETVINMDVEAVREESKVDPKIRLFQATRHADTDTEQVRLPNPSRAPADTGKSMATVRWWALLGLGAGLGLIASMTLFHRLTQRRP